MNWRCWWSGHIFQSRYEGYTKTLDVSYALLNPWRYVPKTIEVPQVRILGWFCTRCGKRMEG